MSREEWLSSIEVNDEVTRMLAGVSPRVLKVTAVEGDVIWCGPWTFSRKTGAEIDEDLGWSDVTGFTGSYIRPIDQEGYAKATHGKDDGEAQGSSSSGEGGP